jgi:hypothetical protein
LGHAAKAIHRAFAGVVHEFDGALLSGLEAHGGARGDVQAHAARGLAVEAQRAKLRLVIETAQEVWGDA